MDWDGWLSSVQTGRHSGSAEEGVHLCPAAQALTCQQAVAGSFACRTVQGRDHGGRRHQVVWEVWAHVHLGRRAWPWGMNHKFPYKLWYV